MEETHSSSLQSRSIDQILPPSPPWLEEILNNATVYRFFSWKLKGVFFSVKVNLLTRTLKSGLKKFRGNVLPSSYIR